MTDETKVQINGYSDDIVSVRGAIEDDFYPYGQGYLFFSNGMLVSYEYDNEGIWRFSIVKAPKDLDAAVYPAGTTTAEELADREYTDVVTFDTGEKPDWVALAYGPEEGDLKIKS